MVRFRFGAAAFAAVLWLLCWASLLCAETISGVIVRVHDGDTVTLLTAEKKEIKVRLAGIDAPELNQAFGVHSKKALSAGAFKKDAVVECTGTDRYGRTLGVLIVSGENLNESQVRLGWAWWYRQYAPEAKSLETLEAEARATRVGLWVDPKPVPPWDFRAAQKGRKK